MGSYYHQINWWKYLAILPRIFRICLQLMDIFQRKTHQPLSWDERRVLTRSRWSDTSFFQLDNYCHLYGEETQECHRSYSRLSWIMITILIKLFFSIHFLQFRTNELLKIRHDHDPIIGMDSSSLLLSSLDIHIIYLLSSLPFALGALVEHKQTELTDTCSFFSDQFALP